MLETWVDKIRTNDPKQVASLYHHDGLLLGTFSDIERKGYDLILEYFENLLKAKAVSYTHLTLPTIYSV